VQLNLLQEVDVVVCVEALDGLGRRRLPPLAALGDGHAFVQAVRLDQLIGQPERVTAVLG